MGTEEYVEYGYLVLPDAEVWPEPNDAGDHWLPIRPDLGMGWINLYGRDAVQDIRAALERAGVQGKVLRRTVTVDYGPGEIVKPTEHE